MKKQKTPWKILLFFAVGVVGFSMILTAVNGDKIATPKKTPEETRLQKIEKQFSKWDGSHELLATYLKESLKDPDSYEHIETRYVVKNDTLHVVTAIKATNSFGAKIKTTYAGIFTLEGRFIDVKELD